MPPPRGSVGVICGQVNKNKLPANLIIMGRFDNAIYDFRTYKLSGYRIEVASYNDFGRFIYDKHCEHIRPKLKKS